MGHPFLFSAPKVRPHKGFYRVFIVYLLCISYEFIDFIVIKQLALLSIIAC